MSMSMSMSGDRLSFEAANFRNGSKIALDELLFAGNVEHYEEVIRRSSVSVAAHRRTMQVVDERTSQGKTATAQNIKTTLDIVEAFTATHLNHLLPVVGLDDTVYTLTQEQITNDLSLATASEKDKLPTVPTIVFTSVASTLHATTTVLFKHRPASSKVIEALMSHPQISEWVSESLTLHDDKDTCEFCLNPFTAERRAELHAHFSKEVTEQRQSLEGLLTQIEQMPFKGIDVRESDLNAQFRPRLKPLLEKLQEAVVSYHAWIASAETSVREKLNAQFAEVTSPQDPQPLVSAMSEAVNSINSIIGESNAISENFLSAKAVAVQRLKLHYAQQFCNDFKTDEAAAQKVEEAKRANRYEVAMAAATVKMKEQQAHINRAQNGREKINERIVSLLNSDAIQIEVVSNAGVDHFILKRNGHKTVISQLSFPTPATTTR